VTGEGAASAHHEAQQNSTPHGAGRGLKPTQSIVLEQLLAGESVTKAAKAGGVDRTTVHRWLREDAVFQGAYNAARRELSREVEARLPHLAEVALATVQAAVEQGDVRAALAVLKGLGALSGVPLEIGTDDPVELAEEKRVAEGQRAMRSTLRRLTTF
jgi:hypothetical protein